MAMKKGQVFIITLVFLVALIFTMQTLFSTYGKIDLSPVPRRVDPYIINNMENAFQAALDSSNDCPEARDNVNHLKNIIEKPFIQGDTVTIMGSLVCPGGSFPASPEMLLNITVSSGDGAAVWRSMTFTKSP